ncbi:MAG: hypothetical protein WCA10_13550 [Terracidiphilus sp.]
MNPSTQNDLDRNAETIEAERSLRLIATLPAPVGIEDRVKSGLRNASFQTGVIAWPLSSSSRASWAQVSYMRAAAAAAIVFVVAGGGWGVYTHFRPAATPTAEAVPQRIDGSGGLSPAGAVRTPKTVEGPRIATPKIMRQATGSGSVSTQPRLHGDRRQDKKKRSSTPVSAPAVR